MTFQHPLHSHIKPRSILISLLFFTILWFTFSTYSSSSQRKENLNSLSYRNHLLNSSPPPSHSKTLTFSSIYVLSLPNRLDRRNEMLKLAQALELDIKFVDALNKTDEWVKWVAERVKEVRDEKRLMIAEAQNRALESIGGLRINSDWLSPSSDLEGLHSFPFKPDKRFHNTNWTDAFEYYFDQGRLNWLGPKPGGGNEAMDVGEYLWDGNEKARGRQVNEGVISTYFGHILALKEMIKNEDESALILEDDVDAEFDLEILWNPIEKRLPKNWEIVMLGHCWGKELLRPAYLHPLLHQSTAPMCLHAYAVSKLGAKNLRSHLLNPWTAFQTPIDTAIPTLISKDQLISFSIEPPLFIQRKDSASDIRDRMGSRWKGLLRDSTVERMKRDEEIVEMDSEVKEDQSRKDPANMFRYKLPCRVN